MSRLRSVDAVVVSRSNEPPAREDWALPPQVLLCASPVCYGRPYRLGHPEQLFSQAAWLGRRVVAVAAIAQPERFFQALRGLGVVPADTLALPDHAFWQPEQLPPADAYFTTEKDAVKLPADTAAEVWVLPLQAQVPAELLALLHERCLKPQ